MSFNLFLNSLQLISINAGTMSSNNSCSPIRISDTVKMGIISVAQSIMGALIMVDSKLKQTTLESCLQRTMQKYNMDYQVLCLEGRDVMLAVMAESFPSSFALSFNHDMLAKIKGKVRTAMCMHYLRDTPEPDFDGVMAALTGVPPPFEQQYASCDGQHIHPHRMISNFTGLSISEFITTAEWKAYHQSNSAQHIVDKLAIEAVCQRALVWISLAMVQFIDPQGPKTPMHPQYNAENFMGSLTREFSNLKVEVLAGSEMIKLWFRSHAMQFQTVPGELNLPSIVMSLAQHSVFQHDPQYTTTEGDNFYKMGVLAAKLSSSIPTGSWIEWKTNPYLNAQLTPQQSAEQKIHALVVHECLQLKISRHFITKYFKFLAYNLMGWNSKESTPFSKVALLFEAEYKQIMHDKSAPAVEYWTKHRAEARKALEDDEKKVRQQLASDCEMRTQTEKCRNCDQDFQYVEPKPVNVVDVDDSMSSSAFKSQGTFIGEGGGGGSTGCVAMGSQSLTPSGDGEDSSQVGAASSSQLSIENVDPSAIYCADCRDSLCNICMITFMDLAEMTNKICNNCIADAPTCTAKCCTNKITTRIGKKYLLCNSCIEPRLCIKCHRWIKNQENLVRKLCNRCDVCNECPFGKSLKEPREKMMNMCAACIKNKCSLCTPGQRKFLHSDEEVRSTTCSSCLVECAVFMEPA